MSAGFEHEGSRVQSLVDALSVSLGRPVLLDDSDLAPIAFSRQWDVDDVRSQSILGRGVSASVREQLLAQGIATARDVVHTADDPALGMEERVCMPVRNGAGVLGYIWLLNLHSELTEVELERLRGAADEIATHLAGHLDRDIADEAALLAALCDPAPEARERAAAEAQARGVLPDERLVLCLLGSRRPGGDPLGAARRSVRRLSVGRAIAATAGSGAVLAASLGDPVLRMLAPRDVGAWVREVSIAPAVAVGQSAPATLRTLDEAFRQAGIALRVALGRPALEGSAAWEGLGADRLVAQLPATALADVPEALAHLILGEPDLAETLATFLDVAGDVKAAAEALSLHRSGLYYRLRRIEEKTGLDLKDGGDRLLAHLAIRASGLAALG